MKYVDIEDLPPCSFSPECLRLIDEMDLPTTTYTSGELASINDLHEERHVRRLRSHVDGCLTCSALLANARSTRTTQRTMFRRFLLANETHVASTAEEIFAALRREYLQEESTRRRNLYQLDADISYREPWQNDLPAALPLSLHSHRSARRHFFQSMLTLTTIAAVLFAAVGLLNRFSDGSRAPVNLLEPHYQDPHQPGTLTQDAGWDSVVFGLTLLSTTELVRGFTFYTYNSVSDRLVTQMVSSQTVTHVDMEGLSSDGQSLLYDTTSPGQQTTYALFSPHSRSSQLFQVKSSGGGDAVWMDASHILVQQSNGTISEVDIQTGRTQHSWFLNAAKLSFYHEPFLYVVGAVGTTASALYRMNLAQPGATLQQVAVHTSQTRFWLSADGTTVFYADDAIAREPGIYAVDSNGLHKRLLSSDPGIPIGYASNNALMVLQQVDSKIEVVRIETGSPEREQVVMEDAAPNATSLCGPALIAAEIELCDENIALAPYGYGLLLHAYYADGSHSLVYDNLATGTSHQIFNLPADALVQLPGWSRWPTVAPARISDAATALCA